MQVQHSSTLPSEDRPVSRQTAGFKRQLAQAWRYKWTPEAGVTDRIVLPPGLRYNPSVPGVFQAVVPVSRLQVASLPHDVLYVLQGETQGCVRRKVTGAHYRPVETVSRRYADRLFRHLTRRSGTAEWRSQMAYGSVRVAGWLAWHKDDPERRKEITRHINAWQARQ